tara:strand:- start:221 stop:616 length:396 start_codon:yes stop_codon:yes gene_type:complete
MDNDQKHFIAKQLKGDLPAANVFEATLDLYTCITSSNYNYADEIALAASQLLICGMENSVPPVRLENDGIQSVIIKYDLESDLGDGTFGVYVGELFLVTCIEYLDYTDQKNYWAIQEMCDTLGIEFKRDEW